MLAYDLAREAPAAGGSASGIVNIGGFSAGLDYRVALLPLLAIVATGALQTLRHPRAVAPA
jgi:hypothetical protein